MSQPETRLGELLIQRRLIGASDLDRHTLVGLSRSHLLEPVHEFLTELPGPLGFLFCQICFLAWIFLEIVQRAVDEFVSAVEDRPALVG